MVVIRLSRVGKKNSPAYRVVVANKSRAVKRKSIEIIGHYNPCMKPKEIVISSERALFWMKQGAQPSDTVRNLMVDLGILGKKEKINKVYGKKLKKKAAKEGTGKPAESAAEVESQKTDTNIAEDSVAEKNAEPSEAEQVSENTGEPSEIEEIKEVVETSKEPEAKE